jgi:RNA polymerase sigma factor (TIGR02999 family)
MASAPNDVTALLLAWGEGDKGALEQLIPIVHQELRRIARRYMAGERPNHTLQASALVNEAYLKLVDIQRIQWRNRAHFLAVTARLMRQVLVDSARRRLYQKRGGGAHPVTLTDNLASPRSSTYNIPAIDEALTALAAFDERKARVVELRFFGGLNVEETAAVLDVSVDTVTRDWRMAKRWLHREISNSTAS